MKKIKKIKKVLKKEKLWITYCQKFRHKQMKFIFSKIALILKLDLNIDILMTYEKKMMHSNIQKKEDMFLNVFQDMGKLTEIKADWESFAKFLFYIYQTSSFFYDRKKKIKNVFLQNEVIEMNQIKRNHYDKWLFSLDQIKPDFNLIVTKILKVVL